MIRTLQDARQAVGQTFRFLENEFSGLSVTLTSAKSLTSKQELAGKTNEPFSLIFTGTPGHCCPQRTYTLSSEMSGQQQIFLVPVGRDPGPEGAPDVYRYQAVFS